MCLIVFSYKTHREYPFILAANRDEFYTRPTREARFWDFSDILAGKDLMKGGTWLGVTKSGKIAALTNYRDIKSIKENAPSRGEIIPDFLSSNVPANEYLDKLAKRGKQYNGFNLIAGTTDRLFYYNNQEGSYQEIEKGYHAISNAFLNTPWPKTEHALSQFEYIVKKGEAPDENKLFELLKNTKRYPDDELPDTGLPAEMERAVSSIFIKTTGYGTRSSTLILVNKRGHLRFVERTYQNGTNEEKETVRYDFQL